MNEFIISKFLAVPLQFVDRFTEGGPFFMSLILVCLLLSIGLLIKGFVSLKKDKYQVEKMLKLTVDSSLLGLVLGFLGSVIGLITAFDSVEAMGNPDPSIFAGGLKVSLLTATFGLLSFVIARIGIFVLRLMLRSDNVPN
ncbi:MotA/TolQ/ExbB proton channel family protein [Winogradskyella sp.]|nr:MotA/TolQ/ExbB proton channel family protein [Winogradskyella sp.]MDB9755470.1 MotA/TolQ/ExbB proton channel family protein [Winogradskyella sp.]MDC0006781.1 MotA/TolQ/ExbB proton channel family protein [Winogradskyella sp.]MDC1504961.1 MotA/TolQ/ExbB proton channel family protein [Winogradskyella sp.]